MLALSGLTRRGKADARKEKLSGVEGVSASPVTPIRGEVVSAEILNPMGICDDLNGCGKNLNQPSKLVREVSNGT